MAAKNEVELEKSTTVAVFQPSVVSSSRVLTSCRKIAKLRTPPHCDYASEEYNGAKYTGGTGAGVWWSGTAFGWDVGNGHWKHLWCDSPLILRWVLGSVAIVFTPGGFEIMPTLEKAGGKAMFYDPFSMYLCGWFIFTTVITYVTLRSTVALCALFVVVDTSVLRLALAYMIRDEQEMPHSNLQKVRGSFAILTGFLAWYNGFAGLADNSNSVFVAPVVHFPWSEKGQKSRKSQ